MANTPPATMRLIGLPHGTVQCAAMAVKVRARERILDDASRQYLARIRAYVQRLAADAGVTHPESFARQWHILMKGSIVAAGEGDRLAARRAREVGALLLQSRLQHPI